MIDFNRLSYWEKKYLTDDIDFTVIGGGIVGIATALELRTSHPSAKIVLLERGYLPTGASTKNAGFTCFGSISELVDDLKKTENPSIVWDTVYDRFSGLQVLLDRFTPEALNYAQCGSYDLYQNSDKIELIESKLYLEHINQELKKITGHDTVNSWIPNTDELFGFKGTSGGFFNRLEGQIDTSKLLQLSYELLQKNTILTIFGCEVLSVETFDSEVLLNTTNGQLASKKIAVTTNAFSKKLFPDLYIEPARAQVLITKKIKNLKLNSTFHYNKGYTYFREIDQRILLGGGRNLAFQEENTTVFENTPVIENYLSELLTHVICPNQHVEIDYFWSGIMGIGSEKKPIIQHMHKNVVIGAKMGGMGVAIGSNVGKKLAELLSK